MLRGEDSSCPAARNLGVGGLSIFQGVGSGSKKGRVASWGGVGALRGGEDELSVLYGKKYGPYSNLGGDRLSGLLTSGLQ